MYLHIDKYIHKNIYVSIRNELIQNMKHFISKNPRSGQSKVPMCLVLGNTQLPRPKR